MAIYGVAIEFDGHTVAIIPVEADSATAAQEAVRTQVSFWPDMLPETQKVENGKPLRYGSIGWTELIERHTRSRLDLLLLGDSLNLLDQESVLGFARSLGSCREPFPESATNLAVTKPSLPHE
jgi:hypothetical protein